MKSNDLIRRQFIKNSMAQHPDNVVNHSIHLWKQMHNQIVFIVGENGFNCIFARSLSLVRSAIPWLPTDPAMQPFDRAFADLKKCLEAQPAEQARDANILLLITFTDIFASLIGEKLTNKILHLAWNIDEPKIPRGVEP